MESLHRIKGNHICCPYCQYNTNRKNNLKRHIITMHHDSSKSLECCGTVFKSKSLLREHVLSNHRSGYPCHICNRNFCRKALLRRHLSVHSGQKDFRCTYCSYATSHKSNLERHQKVHMKTCKDIDFLGLDGSPECSAIKRIRGETVHVVQRKSFCKIKSRLNESKSFAIRQIQHYQNLHEKQEVHNFFKDEQVQTSAHETCYFSRFTKREKCNSHSLKHTRICHRKSKIKEIGKMINDTKCSTGSIRRLSLRPYKCKLCQQTFSEQKDEVHHQCSSELHVVLDIPITCRLRKGIPLTEDPYNTP